MRRTTILLIAVLAVAATPALAAAPALRTGHYTGTTSQHLKLTLRLFYTKLCGGPEVRRLCLTQVGRVKIAAKCADGSSEVINSPDTFGAIVGRTGKVSGSAGIENITWSLTITPRGTIKGSLAFKGDKLTNTSVACHSGKVTFSLKHL
jgi:hypothetical protein